MGSVRAGQVGIVIWFHCVQMVELDECDSNFAYICGKYFDGSCHFFIGHTNNLQLIWLLSNPPQICHMLLNVYHTLNTINHRYYATSKLKVNASADSPHIINVPQLCKVTSHGNTSNYKVWVRFSLERYFHFSTCISATFGTCSTSRSGATHRTHIRPLIQQ